MPGKHLTAAKRQRFTSLRARGLAQYEAMQLVDISRQSAARIERSDEFKAAMKPYQPPSPGKLTYEPPKREMPMETAIKLLGTLRHITNPEGIQAVVNAVRDVIPAEILADELKALESPGLFPTGTDGVSDLPRKAAEADDDPDGDRYGYLVPDLRVRPRTWSPNDRRIDPGEDRVHSAGLPRVDIRPGSAAWERRAQAIRHARNRPPVSGSLVFYQP